jgi:hypothetical protein
LSKVPRGVRGLASFYFMAVQPVETIDRNILSNAIIYNDDFIGGTLEQ